MTTACFFAELGCPRVTSEEYGSAVEWMPCMPSELGFDDDDEVDRLRSEVSQLSTLVKALKFDIQLRAENARLRRLTLSADSDLTGDINR
jgi:hypothetical protein